MKRLSLILLISLSLLGCSRESSILPRYKAEKAFFKAGKLYQRILINPALARKDDYNRTIEAYRRVIGFQGQGKELRDLATRARLQIAQLWLAQKDYLRAIAVYRQVLEGNKGRPNLQALVGLSIARTYEEMGDLKKAIEEYTELAESLLAAGERPQRELLSVPLKVPRLYRRLGKRAEDKYGWARGLYQGIVAHWPESPLALLAQNQIALSYADQGEWRKAADALEKIGQKYPQSPLLPQILYTAANIYAQRLQAPERALKTYQRILKGYPQHPLGGEVLLSMGRVYLQERKPEKARESFQKVIKDFPKDISSSAEAQFGIGSSYEAEGKWDQALNEYRWVIDKYPNTQAALRVPLYLADYYSRKKMDELAKQEYKRAVKTYQRMVESSPKSLFAAYAQERIAQCYIHQRKWKKATSSLWALTRDYPSSPPVADGLLVLGMLYESQLQDNPGARQAYNEFLRRFPHHPLREKVEKKMEELK